MKKRVPTSEEWFQAYEKYGVGVVVHQCLKAGKFLQSGAMIHPVKGPLMYCSYCAPKDWKGQLADFITPLMVTSSAELNAISEAEIEEHQDEKAAER